MHPCHRPQDGLLTHCLAGDVPSHTCRSTAAVALDHGTGCSLYAWRQAKLAKLRRELLEPSSGSGAGAGKGEGMTSSCCSPVYAACSRRPLASSVLLTALPAGNMGITLPGRPRDVTVLACLRRSWRCPEPGLANGLGGLGCMLCLPGGLGDTNLLGLARQSASAPDSAGAMAVQA